MAKSKPYQVTLSSREIGKPLLEEFCPRCFWFTKKFPLVDNHPFRSPMSGIVNITDKYVKDVVRWHVQKLNLLPAWILNQLKNFYPHFDFENIRLRRPIKWQVPLFNSSCLLNGTADEIIEFPDGSWFIIDYKTAALTDTQEKLRPLYSAQLNAYAYLANKQFNKPILGLALVYLDPDYKNLDDEDILHRTKDHLFFGFNPTIVPIKLMAPEWVEDLCKSLFEMLSSDTPPRGKTNCSGCNILQDWLNRISNYL